MQCPNCGSLQSKIRDTRYKEQIKQKRRKHECLKCGEAYITLERISSNSSQPPRLIKRDSRREAFDENKLRKGILLAVAKRPVSTEAVDGLINKVIGQLARISHKEIKSESVGEVVMQELMRLDRAAYIRFASVYRNFKDGGAFMEEAERVEKTAPQEIIDAQTEINFAENSGSDTDQNDGR